MKLKERLIKLRRCIELETSDNLEYSKYEINVEMSKGFVRIETKWPIKSNLRNTWLNDFIVENYTNAVEDKILFKESILYVDAINEFDRYYSSKKSMKKFKL